MGTISKLTEGKAQWPNGIYNNKDCSRKTILRVKCQGMFKSSGTEIEVEQTTVLQEKMSEVII